MWQIFIKTVTSFWHDPLPSWSEVIDNWGLSTVLFIVRNLGRKRKEREERNLRQFLHETLEPQYWWRVEVDEKGRIM
ncbi:hypothetical protein E6O75_ATG02415 [Venturia nashicola]|uniref:Uncharacterized protein n=1 Tax=Venturia nashicola TaxID=86259 RepID=A0A4Z1PKP5_9PEZI|nr:hypothetical protein E6O75_ATG02415 [Venturia nashicola]